MILTSRMLGGACPGQRRKFRKAFPEGAPVTLRGLQAAQRAGLDVWWAVSLLPIPAYSAYFTATAPARSAYDAATASARSAYDAVRARALLAALRKSGVRS